MQNGTYALSSENHPDMYLEVDYTSSSGNLYHITYSLIQDFSSCNANGCSWTDADDSSANQFCNIHDLYCNDESCNPFSSLDYSEKVSTCSSDAFVDCSSI